MRLKDLKLCMDLVLRLSQGTNARTVLNVWHMLRVALCSYIHVHVISCFIPSCPSAVLSSMFHFLCTYMCDIFTFGYTRLFLLIVKIICMREPDYTSGHRRGRIVPH